MILERYNNNIYKNTHISTSKYVISYQNKRPKFFKHFSSQYIYIIYISGIETSTNFTNMFSLSLQINLIRNVPSHSYLPNNQSWMPTDISNRVSLSSKGGLVDGKPLA